MFRRTITTAAAIIAVALSTAASCDKDSPPVAPAPAPASQAPGALKADPEARFKLPSNLCALIKYDPFADLLAGASVPPGNNTAVTGKSVASAKCIATAGGLTGYTIWASADIFTRPAFAPAQYEGFKSIVFRDYTGAKDVTGTGQAAYAYTDPAIGAKLVVWQGDLNLEVTLAPLSKSTKLPDDATARLATFAAQIISALPRA